MACGNNKVSRAGLQTQPTQSVQLATPPMDQVARQRVEQAARTADQQIAQAKSAIDAAKSPTAVRDALSSAQKALDAARRAGGDRQAKARLRSLERQVEEIRKVAASKADDEAALTQMRHAAMRDSLGRQSLGVPRRATTRAPVPPREPVREAANERAADPVSKAPGVPMPESQIVEAENAALQAESRPLDEIVADKKSAQRALSAALRTGAAPEQVSRLKAAIKKLQQTESKKKTPTVIEEVVNDRRHGEPALEAMAEQWAADYRRGTSGQCDVVLVDQDAFTYMYDAAAESGQGHAENRLVAVWGRSSSSHGPRDAYRMHKFPRPPHVDRGHAVARNIGGGYDMNLFPQDPDLNQGRSEEGKRWRALERELEDRVGTEFFVRPIYDDATAFPARLEFGIKTPDGTWSVETFDNRPNDDGL